MTIGALAKETGVGIETSTPNPPCGSSGTPTTHTVNIDTQNLNVVVDMIHGFEVDNNSGTLTVNATVPWWSIIINTNV
jgi:hypothetical protein